MSRKGRKLTDERDEDEKKNVISNKYSRANYL